MQLFGTFSHQCVIATLAHAGEFDSEESDQDDPIVDAAPNRFCGRYFATTAAVFADTSVCCKYIDTSYTICIGF